jgi:hypothetical protein
MREIGHFRRKGHNRVSATPQDDADEVDEVDGEAGDDPDAYVDGQEEDSFPASDPHSDWSGPPERD